MTLKQNPRVRFPRQPSLVTEEDPYLVVFMVVLVVDVVFSVADLGALLPMGVGNAADCVPEGLGGGKAFGECRDALAQRV